MSGSIKLGWFTSVARSASGILILLLGLWLAGCTPAPKSKGKPDEQLPRLRVDHEIRALVDGPGALGLADSVVTEPTWRLLTEFYQRRRHRPIWSKGWRFHREATRLIDAIRRTEEAGLDPGDYELERLTRLLTQTERSATPRHRLRPRNLARFDVLATYVFLRAAEDLREGRVPRTALDPDWAARDTLRGGGPGNQVHSTGEDPAPLFARLEPEHQGYRRLREALGRHRAIARAGGWPEIPPGPPLGFGARGPRVASLIRRLAATGDLGAAIADTVFDRRLERAVGDFQTRLGVPRSGVVGAATRAALNVPVEQRIRQMELNLERWRWLPDTLGRRRVEINIPAYRLELIRDGQVTRTMRVVVGKRATPTPVFSDQITYLEINPTWTLPPSVVGKEIVPALRRKPDYLAANRMHVVSIADAKRDTVDPGDVPWKDATSDSFPYLIVQEAGPDNPLGQIKLMCPNEYDVYLHDTPARSPFSLAVRDYSHGCVRLEHAIEIGDSLLGLAPADSARMDSLVATGLRKRISLPQPVPVHFLYWTAWVDEAGHVYFRDDVYGLDQRLDAALRRRATAGFVLNPDVAISPFWAAAQARAREVAARAPASRALGKRR